MRSFVCALVLTLVSCLAGPCLAQGEGGSNGTQTQALLDALRQAGSEREAAALEMRLRRAFLDMASPSARLLIERGQHDLKARDWGEAERDFDDAVTLDPAAVEAWHGRAVARFQKGDMPGAIRDLAEAVKRQPRDFGAWETLTEIEVARHDWAGALAAWRRVLEVDPHTPGGEGRLRALRRRAAGENT